MLRIKRTKPLYLSLYIIPLIIDSILLHIYLEGGIIYWLDSNFPFNPSIWIQKVFFYYWNDPFFPGAFLAYTQDSLFQGIFIVFFIIAAKGG
ncbi:hypothetical protein [Saccharolobus islandicus]|uniref:Uncharacterized protein n=1 Tax=Saccharolobus islandicus LAL14/1 TaxID=1241935 RepID=M9U890_SACIS|nr:hypothetical protein [Sulfolobus islandicus]AGJ62308.1 Hypothetical Protein SiL_0853 [Sulfolobus islandicus LAL14/1]